MRQPIGRWSGLCAARTITSPSMSVRQIYIDGAVVERIKSFKFPVVHITKDLSRFKHTNTVVKRACQRLFLKRLKIFGINPQILKVPQIQPLRTY
jgi:hypothetical protein